MFLRTNADRILHHNDSCTSMHALKSFIGRQYGMALLFYISIVINECLHFIIRKEAIVFATRIKKHEVFHAAMYWGAHNNTYIPSDNSN